MTADLREAVAFAILQDDADYHDFPTPASVDDSAAPEHWRRHADAALAALGFPLAALERLREGSLVAVPVEATEAMVNAGYTELTIAIESGPGDLFAAYRAMLAARPNATEAGHE